MPSCARSERRTIRGVPARPRWNGPCRRRRRSISSTYCLVSSRRQTCCLVSSRRQTCCLASSRRQTCCRASSRTLMSVVSDGADLAARIPPQEFAEPSMADVRDYLALMKPRVMSLVVFTALVGLMVAPAHVHPVIGFAAILCIAVGAGSAAALNMWYDADVDAVMARTARRPIPAGKIQPGEALAFGVTLGVGAVVVLGLM